MASPLRDALCLIDGVVESDSAFKDDVAFWVNGTEIAHFEADHAIDIRLTRSQIRRAGPSCAPTRGWLCAAARPTG
jgi:hypothetical protein